MSDYLTPPSEREWTPDEEAAFYARRDRTKTYNKLVRDRMPEIIKTDGNRAIFRTLTPDEFILALRRKIVEEANEYAANGSIEELADLLEVVMTAAAEHRKSGELMWSVAAQKEARRGGFGKRLMLVDVEFAEGNEVR